MLLARRIFIAVTTLMLVGTYNGSLYSRPQPGAVLAAQSRKPQPRPQATPTPSGIVGIKLGEGIKLGDSNIDLCNVRLFGVPLKSARIYGHKTDVVKVLNGALFGETPGLKCAGACPCALDNVGECLFNGAPKLAGAGDGAPPPPPRGTVVFMIDGGESGGRSAGSNDDAGGSLVDLYKNAKGESGCSTEFCANSKGEVSVSSKCGDVKLEITSSGKVSMSVTRGQHTVTIP